MITVSADSGLSHLTATTLCRASYAQCLGILLLFFLLFNDRLDPLWAIGQSSAEQLAACKFKLGGAKQGMQNLHLLYNFSKIKKIVFFGDTVFVPVRTADVISNDGRRLLNMTLNPFCFMFNTVALGDVIAAVPVVKYMINNFYPFNDTYMVVAKAIFRPLFPFIPDKNFHDFDMKDNNWDIPKTFAVGRLNKPKIEMDIRLTPKRMHLAQFAAIVFLGEVLPPKALQYVPLEPVDISHFKVDFKNTVILVTTHRDLTRYWHGEYVLEVANWLRQRGVTPVFIGKSLKDDSLNGSPQNTPKNSLPDDVSDYGVDLRNRTSIAELASIFREARAVCGIDSGPIHLAGTTSIPIICGYTSVAAEHRIPYRPKGKTYPIVPQIECINCESRWRSNFWNFENCYLKHIDCCKQMTPDKFITVMEKQLGFCTAP